MPPKAAASARPRDRSVVRTSPVLAGALSLALLAYAIVVGRLHYFLPTPGSVDVDPRSGAPVFNEARSLEIVRPSPFLVTDLRRSITWRSASGIESSARAR